MRRNPTLPALIALACGGLAAQCPVAYEIDPGPAGSRPQRLVEGFGHTLFFSARTPATGTEPFIWSPGTGVTLLRDCRPDAGDGDPYYFTNCCTAAGPRVFFSAVDDDGRELWISDGTTPGTVQVANINPDRFSSNPSQLTACDDRVFFAADDGTHGIELWVSDGTLAGTTMVDDLRPGPGSSMPDQLTCVDGRVFFTAWETATGRELWVSDGTPNGTHPVADIRSGDRSSSISGITAFKGRAYFHADDGITGAELWVSDGTQPGTHVLRDISQNSGASSPTELTVAGDRMFFIARGNTGGRELFATDGTPQGTGLVKDVRPGSLSPNLHNLTAAGDRVFFAGFNSATGTELWVSDGTDLGTTEVDIYPGMESSFPQLFAPVGDGVCFRASNDDGAEIWFSDGSPGGTRQVCDLVPGADTSNPTELVTCRGRLFVVASPPATGTELFSIQRPGATTAMLGTGSLPDRPALTTDHTPPVIGSTVDLVAAGPANHSGVLFAAPAIVGLPPLAGFMTGGSDWVDVLGPAIFVASTVQPDFSWSLVIPNNAALDGVLLNFQMWWVNPNGAPILQASNGLRLALGFDGP